MPSASCCFLHVFYIAENQYQMESKCNETSLRFFMDQKKTTEHRSWARRAPGCPRDRRARPPYWVRPLSLGPLEHPPTDLFHLYKPTYPKNIEYQDRSGVPPPQASVATRNLSGALPGTLPEGGSFTGCHLHRPGGHHDEEGVVHPRG